MVALKVGIKAGIMAVVDWGEDVRLTCPRSAANCVDHARFGA
jgi:hypothetical protein